MKKLLLLLLLIPNLLMAETWHCTYKSTEGPATESSSFERQGEYFTYGASYTDKKFKIAKISEYGTITLVHQGVSDYIVQLHTTNKIDGEITFTALADFSQWKGFCSIK